MAALYLHQALFASNDPPSLPSTTQRNSRISLEAAQASLSKVTLRTSTSEHSHPTESLWHGPYAEDSAYRDILARQPVLPEGSRTSWAPSLSLEGDPLTPGEQKRRWERFVRRRLRRLRWAKRVLLAIIAGWAVYNTVRYFIAFAIYTTPTRQLLLLVCGTASAVSCALLAIGRLLSFFGPRLGWKRLPRSLYARAQTTLAYLASFLILGPAIVNLVFVILWRRSSDPGLSLSGRCHWDVDAAWTGMGLQCNAQHYVPWRYWLTGSVVRVVLTAFFLASYHVVSYQYMVTRLISRRRRTTLPHLTPTYLSPLGGSPTIPSPHTGFQAMHSTTASPVSIPRAFRQSVSESEFTHESSVGHSSSSGHPLLRRSQSHISSTERHSADLRLHRLSSSRSAPSSETGHASAEDYFAAPPLPEDGATPYGSPTRLAPGAYSCPTSREQHVFPNMQPAIQEEDDMLGFVERFRALVQQVSHETDEGIRLAQAEHDTRYEHHDRIDYEYNHSTPSPVEEEMDENDYVPVVGRIIQRMPTIESLGSREVMSLAGPTSRPSTRMAHSPTVSRSNSLAASIVLGSPVDVAHPANDLYDGNRTQGSGGSSGGTTGSRSTSGSFHNPVGAVLGVDSAAAQA